MSVEPYVCGTCGSRTVVVASAAGSSAWRVSCANDHPFVADPGEYQAVRLDGASAPDGQDAPRSRLADPRSAVSAAHRVLDQHAVPPYVQMLLRDELEHEVRERQKAELREVAARDDLARLQGRYDELVATVTAPPPPPQYGPFRPGARDVPDPPPSAPSTRPTPGEVARAQVIVDSRRSRFDATPDGSGAVGDYEYAAALEVLEAADSPDHAPVCVECGRRAAGTGSDRCEACDAEDEAAAEVEVRTGPVLDPAVELAEAAEEDGYDGP